MNHFLFDIYYMLGQTSISQCKDIVKFREATGATKGPIHGIKNDVVHVYIFRITLHTTEVRHFHLNA